VFVVNDPGPRGPGRRPERSDRQRQMPMAVFLRSDYGRLFQERSGRSAQEPTLRYRKTVSDLTLSILYTSGII